MLNTEEGPISSDNNQKANRGSHYKNRILLGQKCQFLVGPQSLRSLHSSDGKVVSYHPSRAVPVNSSRKCLMFLRLK